MTRETWATRTGFILAAVGSAVGLGNIWRFPWMTAENGGSAFLAVYLLIVVAVGVPGLLAEFVIGRRSNRNPSGALRALSGSDAWGYVGLIAVVTGVALLSFYSVVGGWILRYVVESVAAVATGTPAPYFSDPGAHFQAVAFGVEAVGFHLVFLLLTGAVVYAGVRNGIEFGTTLMMPLIVVLLVALAVWAGTQPNAAAGYGFYLDFDLDTLTSNFVAVLGPAAGQALFTLSVGAGTMITYASYLGEDRSLPLDATIIAVLNTFVGVLAGLVVFPLLFSQGVDPTTTGTGAGALFVGLAAAFARLPAGALVAAALFAVVSLAALSSSISMLEIPVSFVVDEFGVSRRKAVVGLLALIGVTGSVTAMNPGLFEFVAGTLVDLLLSTGLLAFLLFVGWVLGGDAVVEYATGAGKFARRFSTPWLVTAGIVLPLFLLFTIFTNLGVDAWLGFWPTLLASTAVCVLAFVVVRRPQAVV